MNNRNKFKQELKQTIAKRNLVWVIEDSKKLGNYVLVRVVDVKTDSDGFVRAVSIQTKDGIYAQRALKLAPVLRPDVVFLE